MVSYIFKAFSHGSSNKVLPRAWRWPDYVMRSQGFFSASSLYNKNIFCLCPSGILPTRDFFPSYLWQKSSIYSWKWNTPNSAWIMALVYLIAFCFCPSGKQFLITISPVNHRSHTLLQTLPFSMPRWNHYASTQYEIIPMKPADLLEGTQITLKYIALNTVGDPSKTMKIGVKTSHKLLISSITVALKITEFHFAL